MTTDVDSDRGTVGSGHSARSWTVLRLILWSADYLGQKGVRRGRLDAEHLLAHVVGVSRLQLYLEYDRRLTADELEGFRPLLRRRAKREPLQYIIGSQPFRELDLEVSPAVLIPRPETELLVGQILDWAAGHERAEVTALDVGTGSGAIALSLALEGPFASVLATDVDEGALDVARRNRDSADLGDKVELRLGPLFDPLHAGEHFDVVVSNPPYVAESDSGTLDVAVVEWEPKRALFGGPDGLDVVRGLVYDAHGALRPGGLLALEVGVGQAGPVVRLLEDTGQYEELKVRRDYSGRERIVLAQGA